VRAQKVLKKAGFKNDFNHSTLQYTQVEEKELIKHILDFP